MYKIIICFWASNYNRHKNFKFLTHKVKKIEKKSILFFLYTLIDLSVSNNQKEIFLQILSKIHKAVLSWHGQLYFIFTCHPQEPNIKIKKTI